NHDLCVVASCPTLRSSYRAMAGAFTAKDFRTWGGTLEAFRLLAANPPPDDPDSGEAVSTCKSVVDEVAACLGNTAAVCRKSYIEDRKSNRLNSSHVKITYA